MAEQLTIPPIRTALTGDSANGDAPTVRDSRTRAVAAKDYWLFWQRLAAAGNLAAQNLEALQGDVDELGQGVADLSQELKNTIRYGTHAARLAAPADPLAALWVETDRNEIVYQAQTVAGAPAWVYVTGAMYGTVIATDQRPAGLSVNDTGLIFLSSDSTSVRWSGSNWLALDRVLDLGPAPPVSQLIIKANGLGGLGSLTKAQDDIHLSFDADYNAGAWRALDGFCAWIDKNGGYLRFARSSGNTPGSPTTPVEIARMNLTSGSWTFDGPVGVGLETALPLYVTGNVAAEVARFQGSVDLSNHRLYITLTSTNPGYWWEMSNQDPSGGGTANGLAFLEHSNAASVTRLYMVSGGGIQIPNLPAGNPGVGSKQIWYDPADGNRVKFSP